MKNQYLLTTNATIVFIFKLPIILTSTMSKENSNSSVLKKIDIAVLLIPNKTLQNVLPSKFYKNSLY